MALTRNSWLFKRVVYCGPLSLGVVVSYFESRLAVIVNDALIIGRSSGNDGYKANVTKFVDIGCGGQGATHFGMCHARLSHGRFS